MISFEIVAYQANVLIEKMALAQNNQVRNFYQEAYYSLLNACGWTEDELDREILKRVDASWESKTN